MLRRQVKLQVVLGGMRRSRLKSGGGEDAAAGGSKKKMKKHLVRERQLQAMQVGEEEVAGWLASSVRNDGREVAGD
ncbi:hypothetical protein MRB53_030429 [Persea americana]|uniref:Uncharacterized protein n=1 Tax=Persea americana TaxID=3435 RepID=A0ACC2KL86_PERAE|nr:hypothetical protein MRB53_030429 [Persea americana]